VHEPQALEGFSFRLSPGMERSTTLACLAPSPLAIEPKRKIAPARPHKKEERDEVGAPRSSRSARSARPRAGVTAARRRDSSIPEIPKPNSGCANSDTGLIQKELRVVDIGVFAFIIRGRKRILG
jgi:hypothetical protein